MLGLLHGEACSRLGRIAGESSREEGVGFETMVWAECKW